MTSEYTLYGTPFSLYTGKLRAYLDYKRIPYKEQLSTAKVYKKIILPNTGVGYVPVLLTPSGEYLQDTAFIIDHLEGVFPERPVMPRQGLARFVSHLLELFGDEWLVIPAMHYRWSFSANAPYLDEAFGSVLSPRLPAFAKRVAGRKLGAKFSAMLPNLGITGLMAPAIEAWYEGQFLPALDAHLQVHDFLLGPRPTLGDFAFYGPLFAHLYKDPVPGKRMRMDAPNVARWVERMRGAKALDTSNSRLTLAKTLSPIFKRMMDEQIPALYETVSQIATLHDTGATRIPRVLDDHTFSIGDTFGERKVIPFQQWKLQRVLDCYRTSTPALRQQIDAFLAKVGGRALTKIKIVHRVDRHNNRLVFADRPVVSDMES